MIFLSHKAPARGEPVLLVMLPGAGIAAGAFAQHGMVAVVQAHGAAHGLAVDVIAAEPSLELYLDGGIAAALDGVIAPLAPTRIWLLGISMGGMGALLYATHARIEGIFLLAPFLGTKGTIAEVAKTGLAAWREENSAATEVEKRMLVWLRDFLRRRPKSPALYLGYGLGDRFAPGHALLADLLPADRVVTVDGGHDWQTWAALWPGLLATRPFGG